MFSNGSSFRPAFALHPPVGTLIDKGTLELVEVLGIVGYGAIYRAVETHHPQARKSYTVKCLILAGQQTARLRQYFIREIALHQLASAHPGVVTLHRVVEQEAHTFLIMDHPSDHDLFTQIVHNCRYLGDDALIKDIFLQLLDAVEYCHSLGIYHRDLSPESIQCFDDGLRIAITDFGLATTDKLSDEFRTGSVYHMSPECQGPSFAPTGNYAPMFKDIWSLGIILLNLVTGRDPWLSATPDDPIFQAYLRDPTGFLPTVLPISPQLNKILVKMLDVDWRERSTMREARYALEEINNFYSDGVIFEGSMARCPWESRLDIDSASPNSSPENSPHLPTAHVENFKSSDALRSQPPTQSVGRRLSAPTSFLTSETPILPRSNKLTTLSTRPPNTQHRPAKLSVNTTNISTPPDFTNKTPDSADSSMMYTAIEYDPYSSMFFINDQISREKLTLMPNSANHSVGEDKVMTSTTAPRAQMKMSPLFNHSNSSASSSIINVNEGSRLSKPRSSSPGPEVQSTAFSTEAQSLRPPRPPRPNLPTTSNAFPNGSSRESTAMNAREYLAHRAIFEEMNLPSATPKRRPSVESVNTVITHTSSATTIYSHAPSSIETSDYGLFYTRRAFSQETITGSTITHEGWGGRVKLLQKLVRQNPLKYVGTPGNI